MDSYRLAQYAVGLPCYICEAENKQDADLCHHCHAPLALARQNEGVKVKPEMIAVLGSAGAGKTVYLGMLMDMLSSQTDGLEMLARGAFLISMQQNTMSAFSRCEFPAKTPSEPDRWNWVHCQVKEGKRQFELITPDMAGEAITTEMEHPDSFPVIRLMLDKSAAVAVLIDAIQTEKTGNEQDFVSMKILSYLSEIKTANDKG